MSIDIGDVQHSPDALRAISLADATDPVLDAFHSALLTPAFPPAELMSRRELVDVVRRRSADGPLLLAGDVPVAGAVVEHCVDGRVLLLAYLTVAPKQRGTGLGSRLMATLGAYSRREDALLLAEIEDPRCHGTSLERGDPAARVRFYTRGGARLLPLAYAQPALRAGSDRVDGLLLIVLNPTLPFVDGRLVLDFLDEYYSACEGPAVLRDDAEVAALRSAARGDSEGRLWHVALDDLDAARRVNPSR